MDSDIISNFFGTIAAAGIGAWIAAKVAVGQWRAEMVARRRADAAEVALTELYRFRERVRDALMGFGMSLGSDMSEDAIDDYFVTYSRLARDADLDLHGSLARFQAIFGRATEDKYYHIGRGSRKIMAQARSSLPKIAGNILSLADESDDLMKQLDEPIMELENSYRSALTADENRGLSFWQRATGRG